MKLIDLDKAIESMDKLEQEDNEAYGVSIPECFDSNRAIKVLNNIPTVQAVPLSVLQEIRQEIEKPLHDERCFDTADAKAQYIALNWVCELIDKHIKEIDGEDLGDYPDTIPNQFDNMTGSMNL